MSGHETLFADIESMDPDRYARHLDLAPLLLP